MSLTSRRETLAKTLAPHAFSGPIDGRWLDREKQQAAIDSAYRQADHLIASGAVVDAAALADDEALLCRAAELLDADDPDAVGLTFPMFRAGLRALAVALAERDGGVMSDPAAPLSDDLWCVPATCICPGGPAPLADGSCDVCGARDVKEAGQ